MVDASHLGYPAGKLHLTFLATEVLETTVGTGLGYLIDTTELPAAGGGGSNTNSSHNQWTTSLRRWWL